MSDLDERLEQLRALYDSLPTIACKGLCANSCGPIDMSLVEHQHLVDLGVNIPVFTEQRAKLWAENWPLRCPALDRRTLGCKVYEDRPLICRIWGMAESMPCPHGCKPTKMLTDRETYEFLIRSYEIGGHRDGHQVATMRAMLDILDDPKAGPLIARFIRGEREVENDLLEAIWNYRREHGF